MPSRVRSTSASWSGLLTSQPLCGCRRTRAPLAPPRLSLPRNVEADAHAVDTSWATVRPEARTSRLSPATRSEEHTSELQSRRDLVCRLLLEKKKKKKTTKQTIKKKKQQNTKKKKKN